MDRMYAKIFFREGTFVAVLLMHSLATLIFVQFASRVSSTLTL